MLGLQCYNMIYSYVSFTSVSRNTQVFVIRNNRVFNVELCLISSLYSVTVPDMIASQNIVTNIVISSEGYYFPITKQSTISLASSYKAPAAAYRAD